MPKLNLADLSAEKPEIKYCCAKRAIAISKTRPEELYGDFDLFVKLLDSENNIMKWTAIFVIGNLSAVDKKNKIDKLLPRLIKFLNAGKMITANNTIVALTAIAKHKPKYQSRIIKEFLKIEKYRYDTGECRNIAMGKVILALGEFGDQIKGDKQVLAFILRQTRNSRPATAKKALALQRRLNKNLLVTLAEPCYSLRS